MQHVETDHLEVEGHLEMHRLGQVVDLPLEPVDAARAGRHHCFREPPVARGAGVDFANQRNGRSADAWSSAEHECRRPEQSEQRRVSRLALGKRRLR
eukprot:scaffold137662_cov121-Phaeocystis_antarctica.AAC.1